MARAWQAEALFFNGSSRPPSSKKTSGPSLEGQEDVLAGNSAQRRQQQRATPSQDAIEGVVLEQVALLEVGPERGVVGVPSELLELGRVDPPILRGVHGASL